MSREDSCDRRNGGPCQMCGARAVIHITSDPARRHAYKSLCRRCARHHQSEQHRCARALERAELAVYFGLVLAVVPVLAEHFPLDAAWPHGYGWLVSVLPGTVFVGVGAAFGARSLLVAGAIWLILLWQATWLPSGTLSSFAMWRIAVALFGLAMLAGGVVSILRNRAVRRRWRAEADRRPPPTNGRVHLR